MLPENQSLDNPDYVLLVIRIIFLQFFKNSCLNQSLFIQTFLIPENF